MLVCMKEANGVVKKRLVFVTIIFSLLLTTCFVSCFSATAEVKENTDSSSQHRLTITTYSYSFSEGKNVPTRSTMIIVSRAFPIASQRQVKVMCSPTAVFEPVSPGETYKITVFKMPCFFGTQFYKIPEQQTTQIITEHMTRIDLNTIFSDLCGTIIFILIAIPPSFYQNETSRTRCCL